MVSEIFDYENPYYYLHGRVHISLPLSTSHNLTVSSQLPESARRPSGDNAADDT